MMVRLVHPFWLLALVGFGCFLGCRSAAPNSLYQEGPLLISKNPVAGNPGKDTGPELAVEEPTAPLAPPEALATAPAPLPDATAALVPEEASEPEPRVETPSFQTQPAVRKKDNVPAIPAIRRKEQKPPSLPAKREVPQRVPSKFGHADDHSWLQGTIDKHYRGYYYLRYCDCNVEDRWGGKVYLGNDERLKTFQDGDIVFVEGEISTDNDPSRPGGWNHYPAYKIKSIRLVERAQKPKGW